MKDIEDYTKEITIICGIILFCIVLYMNLEV